MRDTRLWGFVDSCRGETEALLMWGRIIPLRPVSDAPTRQAPDFGQPDSVLWPGSGSHPPPRGPQQAQWLIARVGRAAPLGPAPAPGGGGGRINIEGGREGRRGLRLG